ncbi:hypothetical protein F183_A00320 [Bryobacterales bacterium F-183]|nr:hypothetical protein F183_A00320 [Bryobacterales bacterium F-183]
MKLLVSTAGLAVFCACAILAQVQSGRVEGNVIDASGASIPSAKLTIVEEKTQIKQETEADASGYFSFPLLKPGLYSLTAEAQGFRKSTISNIELTLGVTLKQDVKLEVGSVTESVSVEASAVRVQSTEATIQRAITLRDIDTLPQLARNPIALASYQPGIQINPADTSFSKINGMRQGSNNNTLDGIDVNDSVLPRLGLAMNAVNTDSVEEFRIITNGAKAEYGRNGGGTVEMITRSGTNQFHGNLFEYHRNTKLNANNFFNKSTGTLTPAPKFIQNQFGGSIGGPVTIPKVYNGKDKAFFFFNFQRSKVIQQVVRNRTVLTPDAKRGIFAWTPTGGGPNQTFNIIQADPRGIGIDKAVAANLALLPDPNNLDVGDRLNTAGYRFNAPANNEGTQWTTKGDYNLRPTHRLWARASRFRTLTPADTLNNAEATFPGQPSGSQGGLRWGFAVGSSWTITPSIVNEFTAGYQSASVEFFRVRALQNGAALISPNLFTAPIPTGFGSARNSPVRQFTDNLSIIRGKHTFKGGVRISLTKQYQTSDAGIWPTFNVALSNGAAVPASIGPQGNISAADRTRFEQLYNDLLGRISSVSTTFYSDLATFSPGKPRVRNFLFNDQGYYFQDDWRVNNHFTLNLGLRWEYYGLPHERDELQGVIQQNALISSNANISDLTVARGTAWYNKDFNNFSPRFGFAWDPFKDGKTSVRGSWGIFYDRVIGASATDVDGNMPGFAQAVTLFPNASGSSDVRVSDNAPLPAPTATPQLTPPANRNLGTLSLFDQNFRTPYVMQMNFTIQREVLRNTVLEVGYVGNRGIKQLADINWNQPRIYDSGFLAAFQELAALRANTPATNQIVRIYGSAATAVSTIGAANLTNNAVGSAANTVDTNIIANNINRLTNNGFSNFHLRNFPQFQNVVVATNAGRTYYNSLQTSIRRQTGSLRFAINYTWSKTIDNISVDGSGFTSPFDNFNLGLNRSLSDSDRPHTLNWTSSYFIPFGRGKRFGGSMPRWLDTAIGGWEIGALGFWTSGPTMTVSSGFATGPTTNATSANFNGDRSIGTVQRVGNGVRFFSVEQTALFTQPAAGSVGTSGRNTFRGPRFFNMDLSLVKRFKVTEKMAFTLRGESYNAFNNTNFATPALSLATPATFGVISSTSGNPRIFQLAGRFDF